jgi:DNA-binding NarL/FixJ family response regulator
MEGRRFGHVSRYRGKNERDLYWQREILQLIAAGYTTKKIASRLQLHMKTAEVQRAQLMAHLNIRNTAGLVRYAIQHGLVSVEG